MGRLFLISMQKSREWDVYFGECDIAPCIPKGTTLKFLISVASALLLLLPQVASAQTPVADEGLQVIAERQYAADPEGNIDTGSEEIYLASVRVYLFDNADGAESTWETLVAADSVEADLPEDDDSFSYEKTEIVDIGDRAMVLNLSAEVREDETATFRTMIIQKGAMIVTVNAIAGSADDAEGADAIAIAMIERQPGDGESEYDGNGGSTGGVWEVFLPADAEELGELQAYADKETRPA